MMDIVEARRVIRDEQACFVLHVEASAVLLSQSESSIEDLLACLRWRGLPAETGAIGLYARTKRQRKDDTIDSLITDLQDWTQYLKEKKFIAK